MLRLLSIIYTPNLADPTPNYALIFTQYSHYPKTHQPLHPTVSLIPGRSAGRRGSGAGFRITTTPSVCFA